MKPRTKGSWNQKSIQTVEGTVSFPALTLKKLRLPRKMESEMSDAEFERYIAEAKLKKDTVDPEFVNFETRVNEINKIVKGLTSKDAVEVNKASKQAEMMLHSKSDQLVSEENCRVKLDKTSINSKAFQAGPVKKGQRDEVDPESFMKSCETDAKRRADDKRERKGISDAYKKRGNDAFRNENYDKALSLYSKAIDEIKDSAVLFTNRALCCLHLKLYKRAISDCDWVFKINENNLRAWLYKAKAHHCMGEAVKAEKCIEEAEKRNPDQKEFIAEYKAGWEPF